MTRRGTWFFFKNVTYFERACVHGHIQDREEEREGERESQVVLWAVSAESHTGLYLTNGKIMT